MAHEARWLSQSPMSDPGTFRPLVDALPNALAPLAATIRGLLIHESCLAAYGVPEPPAGSVSRTTLPLAERLRQIVERDPRPLVAAREPRSRIIGTCRDFALMLCGTLRAKGVESRLRCGFADYLGDGWEDHWLCEYRGPDGAWRLADSQLDAVSRRHVDAAFDPLDVPRSAFLTAGRAWAACRSGAADPARFAAGTTRGAWMIGVDVVRDGFALQGRETSPWDAWRAAPETRRAWSETTSARLDTIAADPEGAVLDLAPDWLPGPPPMPSGRDPHRG